MDRLLRFLLKTFVRRGTFRVTTSRGTVLTFGDGTGQPVSVRFASRAAEWAILLDPELKFGETYMDGTFVVEQGSIADVLAIMLGQNTDVPHWARLQGFIRYLARRFEQFNPRRRSRRNVAHHYDLDGRLYSLFLDADRQYSCGYFENPGQSLDDAQLAKKRHIAAKLVLDRERGDKDLRVLDIGCGWGGLGLYLAETAGADVTGVTLSQEQHAIANERAAEKGLSDRARFDLRDYRDVDGPFDRIVSVGMFEHVGVNHYATFFRKSAQLLAKDGVMLLHSIGRSEGPSRTSPWISKYIFPGGYIPSLSEVLPRIEQRGPAGDRYRDPAPALRRDAQALARAFPRAPRGGRAHLRRALRAHVGILSGGVGNVVPRAEHDGVPDPTHQAARRRADDARLYRARGAPVAGRRSAPPGAAAAGRRITRSGGIARCRAQSRAVKKI